MSDLSLTSLGVIVAHVYPWCRIRAIFDLVCGATEQRLHHSSSLGVSGSLRFSCVIGGFGIVGSSVIDIGSFESFGRIEVS